MTYHSLKHHINFRNEVFRIYVMYTRLVFVLFLSSFLFQKRHLMFRNFCVCVWVSSFHSLPLPMFSRVEAFSNKQEFVIYISRLGIFFNGNSIPEIVSGGGGVRFRFSFVNNRFKASFISCTKKTWSPRTPSKCNYDGLVDFLKINFNLSYFHLREI